MHHTSTYHNRKLKAQMIENAEPFFQLLLLIILLCGAVGVRAWGSVLNFIFIFLSVGKII